MSLSATTVSAGTNGTAHAPTLLGQPDYHTMNDQTILQLIARADERALNEFYRRYRQLVFHIALRILHSEAEAEEVAMDVLTRVWQHAHTYRSNVAKVNTWLTVIARNCAIDRQRKHNVRPERNAMAWGEMPSRAMLRTDSLEDLAIRTSQRDRIQQALAKLPAAQQEALNLVYFTGYTQQEAAKVLDQPLGTVKTRIRLAIQKMRVFLHEQA